MHPLESEHVPEDGAVRAKTSRPTYSWDPRFEVLEPLQHGKCDLPLHLR